MAHYKKLVGEKVYLSPISMDDVETFMHWVNDSEITFALPKHSRIYSLLQEKEDIEKMARGGNALTIIDKETNNVIGTCSFMNIDHLNRNAEIGIMIGDKNYWSQGYGSDALRLLLNFGFNVRNYHNIYLHVRSFNERAIACYEKVGFKRQGVKRDAIIMGNKKYDNIYMDILATEYWRLSDGTL